MQSIKRSWRAVVACSTSAVLCAISVGFGTMSGANASPAPVQTPCSGSHWVASWMMAPSDSATNGDFSFTPTTSVGNQTYRMVISPHGGGSTLRVHLTNRLSPNPVTFDKVTAGKQAAGPAVQPGSLRDVTFGGRSSVTVAPGSDVVSDSVSLTFGSFEPLAISVYVPGDARSPTEHLQGMATSYYGAPGSGNQAGDLDGGVLQATTTAVLYVSGVDVLAPAEASTMVAFGDSITEGFVGGGYSEIPQLQSAIDRHERPTDFLQRRFDAMGKPITVVNSGIWGNRLLEGPLRVVPQLGPSALRRLQPDAIQVAGIRDAIVMFGANDFAIPVWATVDNMIAGYTEIVNRLHAVGVRVVIGTNPPLEYSLLAGNFAPFSDDARVQLNNWVRTQEISDGVVDYDALLRDPNADSIILPVYRGLDNHVGPAGYKAMANLVDVANLQGSGCR